MSSFTGLLNNAVLLLALGVIYDALGLHAIRHRTVRDSLSGLLVGLFGIAVMLTPWELTPGIFFDTRWILLSLCGLFFGLIPTLIAVAMTVAFRLFQGGGGMFVGSIVIITTAAVGLFWRFLSQKRGWRLTWWNLYLFGVLVQLTMLSCMFLMPIEVRFKILAAVAPPILLIYPIGTLLLGLVLRRQRDRHAATLMLEEHRQQLDRERGLLRGLINSIPDIIFFKNTEGQYLDCNQAFAQQMGISQQSVIGKTDFDLFDRETAEPLRQEDQNLFASGDPLDKEEWIQFPSGQRLMMSTHKAPFRGLDGTLYGLAGIGRDTTERKQSEAKLRESELKFRLLADHTFDWEYWVGPDGKYNYISPSCERITGYRPDEFMSNPQLLLDITKPEHAKKVHHHYTAENSSETHDFSMEFQIITKNGEERWLEHHCIPLYDEQGHFAGRRGNNRDITERKQVAIELSQQKALFEAIFKCIPDAIVYANIDREVVGINSAFSSILGFTIDDLAGKKTSSFYEHLEEYKYHGKTRFNLTAAEKTLPYEVSYRRKDGSLFPGETLGTVIKGANGTVMGYVGVIRDITDRKNAEEERQELEVQLRQKFKMEAVGTMAGGIAHNFNNNLGVILGNVELSQLKINNPEVNGLLQNAKIAIMRSRDLVSQIMMYSRKGVQSMAPLQLPIIINETLKLLRSTIPSTIQLHQTISPDSYHVTINADASQIQEILLNLYNNAVHAMDEKGELNISLAVADLTSKDISDPDQHEPGRYAKISIQDTGCGMTAETQEKIFDPFFTTKEMYEGTGMGLSTVYGIIEQHKGLITVESTVGQGTTFELYFPVIKQPQTAAPTPVKTNIPRGSEHILFVDDDEMLAKLGELLLTEIGYQVTTMTDSSEAQKLFAANAEHIDLVITDQTMPQLCGKDLIQELKKVRPDIATILCTGYSSKINEEDAKELGISAFLMKPLGLPELAQTVRKVLDGVEIE